jgi:hypothetical protein
MPPHRDVIEPLDLEPQSDDALEGPSTIPMQALPFAADGESLGEASTIDLPGADIEAWIQSNQAQAPAQAAPARGDFKTMVEAPAVASAPNLTPASPYKRRTTQPTIAEAPPVSATPPPPVDRPTHANPTMAEMSAFTPPPKKPLQPQQKTPPIMIAVIAALVLAIIAVVLILLDVI